MHEQSPEALRERIVELESKVAFQDRSIQELSAVAVRQQEELGRLSEQLEQLAERIRAVAPSPVGPESEETPPPHY